MDYGDFAVGARLRERLCSNGDGDEQPDEEFAIGHFGNRVGQSKSRHRTKSTAKVTTGVVGRGSARRSRQLPGIH